MPNAPVIAIDTNVLLDLADNNEVVLDCFSTISKKFEKAPILVLPTVIGELGDLVGNGDEEARHLAFIALTSIRKPWGFHPINLIPVGHGIVEESARKIREAGLVPEYEVHDSFLIVEAALANVTILLSSDSHLKNIDQGSLKKLLDEQCAVECPIIFSPWKIVDKFYNSVH
jgi:hypothetical protein